MLFCVSTRAIYVHALILAGASVQALCQGGGGPTDTWLVIKSFITGALGPKLVHAWKNQSIVNCETNKMYFWKIFSVRYNIPCLDF